MTQIAVKASLEAENAQYGYAGGTEMLAKRPVLKVGEVIAVGEERGLYVIEEHKKVWFLLQASTQRMFSYDHTRGLRRI